MRPADQCSIELRKTDARQCHLMFGNSPTQSAPAGEIKWLHEGHAVCGPITRRRAGQDVGRSTLSELKCYFGIWQPIRGVAFDTRETDLLYIKAPLGIARYNDVGERID
ncbi:hypothetical protein GCM10022626_14350 [[Pseudomonas] carboxydohydrogena]|nr:hypothetical protein CRBSH125_22860 [Afipia carboxidovorans]